MTREEASDILELSAHAGPAERSNQYDTLRRQLEDKLAKAPTPGLREKYRASLKQLEEAFAVLSQADDSAALPVAQKQTAGGGTPSSRSSDAGSPLAVPSVASGEGRGGGPGSTDSGLRSQVSGFPTRRKSGGKEFLIVAIIAVVVLAGGGWFVMKTRAENAEKARLAAELVQKAAAEQERLALEKKQAEEAEVLRRDKLFARLRGDLAEAKVTWEAIEREERTMDRKLGELKSDLRSLRDAPAGRMAEARATVAAHQRYYDWLSETLARHPARVARGKAEELLAARQIDDAAAAMGDLKTALVALEREIATQRTQLLDLDGVLEINTDANVAWNVEDAFGQVRSGTGPVQLDGVAVGPAKLQLRKPAWPDRTLTVTIAADRPARPDASYRGHLFEVTSTPEGADVLAADGTKIGVTPFRLAEQPPGKLTLSLRKEGYYPETVEVTLPAPGTAPRTVALRVRPKGFGRPARWNGPAKARLETSISTQSTGSYGSNTTMHFVEEWDFSDPDPKVGWRQAIRRWVSLSGTNREYMPVDGSAVRLRRQADGTWNGEFIQGGLKDPAHNSIWVSAPASFWIVTFGLLDFFPPEPVEVGGTWPVRPEVFFPTVGLKTATGKVQGRLLNLERDAAGEEWADVEYAYSYTMATVTSQDVMKLRVNVSDGYAVRMTGQSAATAGDMKISSSYTSTITKR